MVTEVPTAVGLEEPSKVRDTAPPSAPKEVRLAPLPGAPGSRLRWYRPRTWPRDWLILVAYWSASRLLMLALLRQGHDHIAAEVHVLYRRWDEQLRGGSFPIGDVSWQYPPGAAFVMIAPGLVPRISYLQAFVLLMLVSDAVVLLALVLAVHRGRGRSPAGAWMWALALPLLLSLPFARYDVLVTGLAVLALLALPTRPRLGGTLVGLAAVIKVWPVLTVLGTPRGRTTRGAWLALTASAGVLLLMLATAFRGAFAFLFAQQERGVEIESMGGAVLHAARLFGWPGEVKHQYGSFEFVGPYVSSVAAASLLLTAAAFAWLLLWRVRARRWTDATPYDAALAAVLLFTTTSRVISPQYLIWLIGLAAVCLTVERTTQRPVAVLLLLVAAVTTIDYPLFFSAVVGGSWQGTAVVVVRDGLLLAATLLSCVRLWRATVPRRPRGAGRLPRPGHGAAP
ncbi:glycosyltransferase family 87 protein [Streptomyces sp. NPDC051776]|uniref:glycosyltransferase family 87 protein n=1 Tax=Streptomyces sp. NPDC051776 TaxID=3155414 RepID=UPI0034480735